MIVGNTYTDGGVKWKVVTDKPPAGAWGGGTLPVGSIIPYMNNDTLPEGFLFCNGAAISRNEYHDLFDVIGTTYGSGDGSTTFNVPDLRNKFLEGSTSAGTNIAAGLPNITGKFSFDLIENSGGTNHSVPIHTYENGAIYASDSTSSRPYFSPTGTTSSGGPWNWRANLDASRSSSIYGNSTTVQPTALTAKYIIAALPVIYPFDHEHDEATTNKSGFMSSADKASLNQVVHIPDINSLITWQTSEGTKAYFKKWLITLCTNYWDDDTINISSRTSNQTMFVATITFPYWGFTIGTILPSYGKFDNNLPKYSNFITFSYVNSGTLYVFGTANTNDIYFKSATLT